MFRTAYIVAMNMVITFYSSVLSLFSGLISPYSERTNGFIRQWARMLLNIAGIQIKIEGLEHIKKGQPYIYMANHQGNYDIMSCFLAIPGTARFVAKKELFRIPVFAHAMRAVGMIEIDRGNSSKAKKTLDNAVETIRKNSVSIIIFPEGTRSRNGQIQRFKKGGFVLAIRSGLPIIPMSISGSFHIMQKESWKMNRGHIKVVFSKPIESTQYNYEQRNQLVEDVQQIVTENFDPDYK